jgi:hypothetical protein
MNSDEISQYGVCRTHLHFCPNCDPNLAVARPNHPIGHHTKFAWALDLVCPICRCLYTICTLCSNQRTRLLNKRSVVRHNRLFHLNRPANSQPPSTLDSAPNSPTISEAHTDISSLSSTTANHTVFNFHDIAYTPVNFTTLRSTLYFEHQIKDGSGPVYLASQSIFQLDHHLTFLKSSDVSLNLLIGHLVILLPGGLTAVITCAC